MDGLLPSEDGRKAAILSYLAWEFSKAGVRAALEVSYPVALAKRVIEFAFVGLTEKPFDRISLVRLLSPMSNRAQLFTSLTWTEEDYGVADLGVVLPKCGDLPPEVIVQKLPTVLEYIRANSESGKSGSASVAYISNLAKISEALENVLPLVVEPGRLQRNAEKMREYYGRNFEVDTGSGYIEDGNHRALATILATGKESIRAFVGRV